MRGVRGRVRQSEPRPDVRRRAAGGHPERGVRQLQDRRRHPPFPGHLELSGRHPLRFCRPTRVRDVQTVPLARPPQHGGDIRGRSSGAVPELGRAAVHRPHAPRTPDDRRGRLQQQRQLPVQHVQPHLPGVQRHVQRLVLRVLRVRTDRRRVLLADRQRFRFPADPRVLGGRSTAGDYKSRIPFTETTSRRRQ